MNSPKILSINNIERNLSFNINKQKLNKISIFYKNNSTNKTSITKIIEKRLIKLIGEIKSYEEDHNKKRSLEQLKLIYNFIVKQNIILNDDFKKKLDLNLKLRDINIISKEEPPPVNDYNSLNPNEKKQINEINVQYNKEVAKQKAAIFDTKTSIEIIKDYIDIVSYKLYPSSSINEIKTMLLSDKEITTKNLNIINIFLKNKSPNNKSSITKSIQNILVDLMELYFKYIQPNVKEIMYIEIYYEKIKLIYNIIVKRNIILDDDYLKHKINRSNRLSYIYATKPIPENNNLTAEEWKIYSAEEITREKLINTKKSIEIIKDFIHFTEIEIINELLSENITTQILEGIKKFNTNNHKNNETSINDRFVKLINKFLSYKNEKIFKQLILIYNFTADAKGLANFDSQTIMKQKFIKFLEKIIKEKK